MDFMKLLTFSKKQKNTGEPNLCNLSFPWLPPLSLPFISLTTTRPTPSLTPKPTFPRLPPHPQNLAFSCKPSTQTQNQDQNQNQDQTQKLNSSQPDKKSFAIATGGLFLGFNLQLIKGRNNRKVASAGSEIGFLRDGPNGDGVNGGGRGERYDSKERIGIVIEDKIEPYVIGEQRIKDVEAEQKRRVVTSPGYFGPLLDFSRLIGDKNDIQVCLLEVELGLKFVVAYVLVSSAQFHKMDPLHGYGVPVTNQYNEETVLADRLHDYPLNGFDVPVTDWDNEASILGIGELT